MKANGRPRLPPQEGRVCTRCTLYKAAKNFWRKSTGRLMSECKACSASRTVALTKRRIKTDPEFRAKSLARICKWRSENPERAKETQREGSRRYQQKNREGVTPYYARHCLTTASRRQKMARREWSGELVEVQQLRLKFKRILREKAGDKKNTND